MSALRKDLEALEGPKTALFDKTVQAIRDSLEASLNTIFILGAVAMLFSFLLILTIPEVSMDIEPEDKKRSERRA
jgi:hypothetical protein